MARRDAPPWQPRIGAEVRRDRPPPRRPMRARRLTRDRQLPDFVADSTIGRLNFHAHIAGHWAVVSSHPADFTP